jgi:hypothetical protein
MSVQWQKTSVVEQIWILQVFREGKASVDIGREYNSMEGQEASAFHVRRCSPRFHVPEGAYEG